jgi:serine/threonine protein kinase
MATSFHGFVVKEKIGAGGMSTVYMGHHETLGYPVAIKILHPGMGGDQSFISRFEREAKAASSLHNNNIATVIDFGSEDGIYFIVMQYIDGEDLGKILTHVVDEGGEPQFPLEISLPLLEEVAYGLKDAHQQGIIHRDIKPSNILLSKRGEVKIADFGLARDTSDIGHDSAMDLTMPGTVVGTPSYMSPEQAVGGEVDLRTDIFSLGVMAYQMIVGEKPFTGDSPADVQEQIINAEPPRPTEKNCPRITPEIENLLAKTMAKDPANRFQNMGQVIRALMAAQESIDPSGSLLKYKREYMTKFACDPVDFSRELREKAVKAYLKRGYYFKNMGLSSINDAIREFSYVLSIEPDHSKARDAVKELRRKAEESGILPAATAKQGTTWAPRDSGKTQVMPTGVARPGGRGDTASESAPAASGGSSRRGLLWGSLGAIAVIAALMIFVLGRDGTPPTEQPSASDATPVPTDVASVDAPPPASEEPAGEAETPPAAASEIPPAATTPTESPTQAEPAAPRLGTLRVTSAPRGAKIYLKQAGESFRLVGTAPVTNRDLKAGAWEVRAELDGYVGQSKVVTLAAGADRDLVMALNPAAPPKPTGPGYVKLVIRPYGDVLVDGEQVATEVRAAVLEVAAGTRSLRIRHPAIIGEIVLANLAVGSGDTLDLGQQRLQFGGVTVAASVPGAVQLVIEGKELDGDSPLTAERVLTGRRYLAVNKAGFVVEKAWLFAASGKQELVAQTSGRRAGQYEVNIVEGQTLRVKFDLRSSP